MRLRPVGLVPRQWSTGGKAKLLGISKRGNPYLRKMFIHGARGRGVTGQTRRLQSGEVDERIGNQNRTQRSDRRDCQQTGQDQLGGFSERERLSAAT